VDRILATAPTSPTTAAPAMTSGRSDAAANIAVPTLITASTMAVTSDGERSDARRCSTLNPVIIPHPSRSG
jgi:hypothetical protein